MSSCRLELVAPDGGGCRCCRVRAAAVKKRLEVRFPDCKLAQPLLSTPKRFFVQAASVCIVARRRAAFICVLQPKQIWICVEIGAGWSFEDRKKRLSTWAWAVKRRNRICSFGNESLRLFHRHFDSTQGRLSSLEVTVEKRPVCAMRTRCHRSLQVNLGFTPRGFAATFLYKVSQKGLASFFDPPQHVNLLLACVFCSAVVIQEVKVVFV